VSGKVALHASDVAAIDLSHGVRNLPHDLGGISAAIAIALPLLDSVARGA